LVVEAFEIDGAKSSARRAYSPSTITTRFLAPTAGGIAQNIESRYPHLRPRHFLKTTFPSAQDDFFECTDEEGEKESLRRSVTSGAPFRYCAISPREIDVVVANHAPVLPA
jgi:hypothetical protein